jgi:hypothetical protein
MCGNQRIPVCPRCGKTSNLIVQVSFSGMGCGTINGNGQFFSACVDGVQQKVVPSLVWCANCMIIRTDIDLKEILRGQVECLL